MSLLVISFLFMVPVVESSFAEDVWFGITGFFSMLVTGMVSDPFEECDDGTLPGDCSAGNKPFYCDTVGVDQGDGIMLVTFELFERCDLCGCYDDDTCEGDGSCEPAPIVKPTCGDGVAEGLEECDGDDMGDYTSCSDYGYDSGSLTCGDGCQYNTSGCYNDQIVCSEVSCLENYGVCGGQETTDCNGDYFCGVNMFGECDIFGQPALCGNGEINDGEVCDGTNLTGYTCADQTGFASGTLACSDDCLSFDTNACVADPDDPIDPDEPEKSSKKTCGTVGGTCTDFCDEGYLAYDSALLDTTCDQAYIASVSLICCVPGDVQNSPEGEVDSEEEDIHSVPNSIKDSLKSPTEAGPGNFVPEESTGLQRLFSDAGHVMGGVWVIFALVVVIVGTTYFLHRKFHKN